MADSTRHQDVSRQPLETVDLVPEKKMAVAEADDAIVASDLVGMDLPGWRPAVQKNVERIAATEAAGYGPIERQRHEMGVPRMASSIECSECEYSPMTAMMDRRWE